MAKGVGTPPMARNRCWMLFPLNPPPRHTKKKGTKKKRRPLGRGDTQGDTLTQVEKKKRRGHTTGLQKFTRKQRMWRLSTVARHGWTVVACPCWKRTRASRASRRECGTWTGWPHGTDEAILARYWRLLTSDGGWALAGQASPTCRFRWLER